MTPSPPPPLPLHEACGVPTSMPVFLLPAGLRPVKDVLWAVDAIDAVGAGSADSLRRLFSPSSVPLWTTSTATRSSSGFDVPKTSC